MVTEKKVAFITGIARGQGRAHALKLASRGMNIVGLDICADIPSMDYSNATEDDLLATVKQVEEAGAEIVAGKGDVRSDDDLRRVLQLGLDRFGRVDVLIANAGIIRLSPDGDRDRTWCDIIDVNLTGVWRTIEVVLPAIRAGGRGGSIVITSSTAGLKGTGTDKAGAQAYSAAKRGLGGPEAGAALVSNPKVEKVSFTGGPAAARQIMHACAEQLKPAVLELGGKTGSIVFPDAGDLRDVAERAVRDSIGVLAGQGCVVPTRLIVHDDIYDDVVELVTAAAAAAAAYKVGDPFDPEVKVGPLINAAAVERVCGMLDRARRNNAGRIVLGGNRAGGNLAGKNFVEPTVIVDADPQHEIAQTEIFGPVLLVFRFSTEDEAVELANSTPYGLGANIQSTNLTRVHRLAERLKAGGVYVNGARQNLPHTPFGGLGVSGYGKEGGRAGIDEFLRYKTVSIIEP